MNSKVIAECVVAALNGAVRYSDPYPHWLVANLFPPDVVRDLARLPFPVPDLGGHSGRREYHNATRTFFGVAVNARLALCRAVAEAFQDPVLIWCLSAKLGAKLEGTSLRIEYAQDTDGFWLEPHTDLNVKRLALYCYLASDPGQEGLGTDIYRDSATRVGRVPFRANSALVFLPSQSTWHAFDKRPIAGVRKTLIVTYVSPAWRSREQLAFPGRPVQLHRETATPSAGAVR